VENQTVAAEVPALEAEHARIEGKLRGLEVLHEHHRLSRQQSSGGACPFLGEPCLNIQRRGTNSLATYFDRLIVDDERELAPLRAELVALAPRLERARQVKSYCDKLDEYEQQHRQAADRLAELDAQVTALRQEQTTIEEWLAGAFPDERALAEAQAHFKASDDADKRLRELAPLNAELKRNRERDAELVEETTICETELADLAGTEEALQHVNADLAALGDPRQEVAALQGPAGERATREAATAALERTLAGVRARLIEIERALAPFASVDAEQRAIEEELERTRPGYTRYFQHEQTAARLPECETALAAATAAAHTAAAARERVASQLASARAAFDADELARVTADAKRLTEERGGVTERLRAAQQESQRLTAEIARVEALLDDLRVATEERDTLLDLEKMLQQFRDTIKEAGPNIMKALLRQISIEANRIFGEILGDRSAQLAWENDYEIVLRRDGKERSFAQLSGGEQMSAALAVRLALLRGLTRLDIAFFDEPTQNMDGERRGNLAEQIRRVRGFEQLVVISHDDTFEQGLDNVIHLEKRGGETIYIEEGTLVMA
jgi:exonuclease SbcC